MPGMGEVLQRELMMEEPLMEIPELVYQELRRLQDEEVKKMMCHSSEVEQQTHNLPVDGSTPSGTNGE